MHASQIYQTLTSLSIDDNFEFIHEKWKQCFVGMLKSLHINFTIHLCQSLFYNFRMENATMFHIENHPIYKDYSNTQLLEAFIGECRYISSDRYDYDRIFRTHWLFLRTFEKEIGEFLEKKYLYDRNT